jgi:hypothetical protein
MTVTKKDVEDRINAASALLLKQAPTLPMPAGAIIAVADQCELPIGREDVDADPVARAIFLKTYVKEARQKYNEAVDVIWQRLFGAAMAAA